MNRCGWNRIILLWTMQLGKHRILIRMLEEKIEAILTNVFWKSNDCLATFLHITLDRIPKEK